LTPKILALLTILPAIAADVTLNIPCDDYGTLLSGSLKSMESGTPLDVIHDYIASREDWSKGEFGRYMQGLMAFTVDNVADQIMDPLVAPVGMMTQCYRKKAEIRGVDFTRW
jgi:hypothetical protein